MRGWKEYRQEGERKRDWWREEGEERKTTRKKSGKGKIKGDKAGSREGNGWRRGQIKRNRAMKRVGELCSEK